MIPNFKQVDKGIFRGGQPKTRGDWQSLVDLSINKSIKLNTDESFDGGPDHAPAAISVCKFPIGVLRQILVPPSRDLVRRAVAQIRKGAFIHCDHGEDRTGLVVGCFRVWKQGWRKEAAWKEMLENGFHPQLLGLVLFWNLEVSGPTKERRNKK